MNIVGRVCRVAVIGIWDERIDVSQETKQDVSDHRL